MKSPLLSCAWRHPAQMAPARARALAGPLYPCIIRTADASDNRAFAGRHFSRRLSPSRRPGRNRTGPFFDCEQRTKVIYMVRGSASKKGTKTCGSENSDWHWQSRQDFLPAETPKPNARFRVRQSAASPARSWAAASHWAWLSAQRQASCATISRPTTASARRKLTVLPCGGAVRRLRSVTDAQRTTGGTADQTAPPGQWAARLPLRGKHSRHMVHRCTTQLTVSAIALWPGPDACASPQHNARRGNIARTRG